jgi:hypothetical protein
VGKTQQGRQHWQSAVAEAETLLTDNMFRVKKERRNKTFTTNASGNAVSTDTTAAVPEEKRLLPEVMVFQTEYSGHEGEMEVLLSEADARTQHWRWYCLSDQVTQAFEGLDRLIAIASRPYFPPYAEPPSLTLDLLDIAEKQCEHVRARLDTFIRASHMLTTSSNSTDPDALEREQQWSEDFTGDTAHRWKSAKDSIKHLRVLSKDQQIFHRFAAIARRVPSLCRAAGQLSVADLTWSEAKQCGLLVLSKSASSPTRGAAEGSAEERVQEERESFETFYHATALDLQIWLGKAKEENLMERSGEVGEHTDVDDELDLLSPEACVIRSEWWLKQALQANQVPFEYPPRDTGSCVVPATVSLAVVCRQALRCTLDELQNMYEGMWEIEPFFTESERRYKKAGDAITILSLRELVHRKILRYMVLCSDMTYLTVKRLTRREVHLGEGAEDAEVYGPDARKLEFVAEALQIAQTLLHLLKTHVGKETADSACLIDDLKLFASLHERESAALGLDASVYDDEDDEGSEDLAGPTRGLNPFGESPTKYTPHTPPRAIRKQAEGRSETEAEGEKETHSAFNPFEDSASEDEGGSLADFLGDDERKGGGSAASMYADLAGSVTSGSKERRESMLKMFKEGKAAVSKGVKGVTDSAKAAKTNNPFA